MSTKQTVTLILLILTLGACATKYDCGGSTGRSCQSVGFVVDEMYKDLPAVKARSGG